MIPNDQMMPEEEPRTYRCVANLALLTTIISQKRRISSSKRASSSKHEHRQWVFLFQNSHKRRFKTMRCCSVIISRNPPSTHIHTTCKVSSSDMIEETSSDSDSSPCDLSTTGDNNPDVLRRPSQPPRVSSASHFHLESWSTDPQQED